MALSRRSILWGGAASALGLSAPWWLRTLSSDTVGAPVPAVTDAVGPSVHRFVSPQHNWKSLPYSVGWLNTETGTTRTIPTPFLGHSVVGNPLQRNRVVMFAQRPGNRAALIDLQEEEILEVFTSRPGGYFYGHGVFSADGQYLFATENSAGTHEGRIVVRDAITLKVLDVFDSHGLGPHDIQLIDGGKTFVIANGGVASDPDGSEAIDVPMQPSLTFTASGSGKLLDHYVPSDTQLSVRHLAVTSEGDVAAGLNRFGPRRPSPMLLVSHRGGPVREIAPPTELMLRMGGSLSLCIHGPSGHVGVTSKGAANLVTFWNVRDATFRGHMDLESSNGIGLSPDGRDFVISTGSGDLHLVDATTLAPRTEPTKPHWARAKGLNWRHMSSWTT